MRKISLLLICFFALSAMAQITTNPAIIEKGYTGKIIITFDATKGSGGMVGATKCYAHTGYCTPTKNWINVVGQDWRSPNAPQKKHDERKLPALDCPAKRFQT